MKKYEKIQMITIPFVAKESISSAGLTGWLESDAGIAYSDAGITTYQIES